jgi:argininosuccinate synthase
MSKLLIAYSGGLDTSYCARYLQKKGFSVHAAIVNTGGFSPEEIKSIEERAYQLGVEQFTCLDERENFYTLGIRYLVYGNVLRNQIYPLSVSAERIFQALALVKFARKHGFPAIAHGSTGAGNDQIRFDSTFQIMAPEIKVITPIRDQKLTRHQEMQFLQDEGIDISWEKSRYSVNKGLWGTSVGGKETLNSTDSLPDEAYPTSCTANGSIDVAVHFTKGELTGVNDNVNLNPLSALDLLQQIVEPFAIGRDIHVGDTIVGIKGRVGFEAGVPLLTIRSHQLLEKHVLTKWQLYWKEQLGNWYGMFMHESQYFDPVMRDIESFLENSQHRVNGTVFVSLHPYRFELLGIESPNDLMNPKFAVYGEQNDSWTGEDVKGFTKIFSNASMIYRAVNSDYHD